MTNIKIKGEEAFRKLFSETFKEIPNFREKFDKFKSDLEEKRDWVDERSEKWHDNPENEEFNNHLNEVERFAETLEGLLDELGELEYPNNND